MKTLKVVNSMSEVDFSSMKFPNIGVFWHPDDFPESCVARIFDGEHPMDTVMLRQSPEEIQWDIKRNTNFTFLPRCKEDALSVFGVWM